MHSLRTTLAAAAALVAIGVLGVPGVAAAATPAPTATASASASPSASPSAATGNSVSLTISPASAGVLKPSEDFKFSLTVNNGTGTDLAATTAEMYLIRTVVGSRDDLTDWLGDTSADGYLGVPVMDIPVPAVAAHESRTVTSIDVPAASMALTGYTFGARKISVAYDSGDTSTVTRSTLTWDPSSYGSPTDVSVAMPITVPESQSGVLSPATLAADTAVDGTLTAQLDAAEGHSVAIGIDPRIIASIRRLGVNAPTSALAWLDRLERLHNEKFALTYADSDVVGLHQAGASSIEGVISLDQEIDASNFPGAAKPTPTPTPTGSATASASASAKPTPSATGTAKAGSKSSGSGGKNAGSNATAPANPETSEPGDEATIPTTSTLLSFPYTLDGVAWPQDDTVGTSDLAALSASGVSHTILASSNTSAGSAATVPASEKVSGSGALVSDTGMSSLLRAAATATTETQWQTDIAELTATLATTTRLGTSGAVLLTLDRTWPTDATRLGQTLDVLDNSDWVSPTDLSSVVSETQGSLTLASKAESSTRVAQLRALVSTEKASTDFSTAVSDPTLVTAPARLKVLALASNSWSTDPVGLATAVGAEAKRTTKMTNSVGIVNSSSITLLGDRTSLPISIRNKSQYEVKVHLTVTPSNSFLRVTRDDTEVDVQPNSTYRATVPVQSVANGKVQLALALTTATGIAMSNPSTVEINVQAQWESIITGVAAAAVIVIFGVGILRNIRRRMRRRRLGLDDEDEPDPNRPVGDSEVSARDTAAPLDSVPPLDNEATSAALAGAPTVLAVSDGDSLQDALARAGAAPGLQAEAAAPIGGRRSSSDGAAEAGEDFAMASTGPQPPVDAATVNQRGLGKASALLASGTMFSRVLGFVKTFVLAAAIGQSGSAAANAFAVSNQLPNSVYTLIAGGLLSAALIPQIVRATKHPDGGQKYINKIVTIGGVLFFAVTVAATMAAPLLVGLYSQHSSGGGKGFSESTTALAVAFAFWCLPQILFYALYTMLGEILNARQVFGPFTWAPLINNVIAIVGLVVFIAMFGGRAENSDPTSWTPLKIAVLAGTATLGVAVQAVFLVFFWRRAGLTYRPDFRWRGVGLRSTGTATFWLFLMILTTQAAGIVQSRVTSLGTGAANATLQNSWLLFMLPHSIVTVSIATAYFTRMSHDADRGDLAAVRRNLSLSLRIVGLFTVFASIALMVVAFPFARLYEHSFRDVTAMAQVLIAYMPGLVLFSMLFIIQRAFWATHDNRTPFFLQLIQSTLFVIGVIGVAAFPGSIIGVGVAAMTTIAGTAQTIVAIVVIRRRLGGIEGPIVARSHTQFITAAVISGCAGLVVAAFFGAFKAHGFAMTDITSAGITLVLTGAVMAIVYFVALVVAKNAEVASAVDLLRARIRR
jgi:murein biosynthesis integral membrane protein MurJ